MNKKKIAFVVAEVMTADAFLVEHLRSLSEYYDISLIANAQSSDFFDRHDIPGRFFSVPIRRSIQPIADLRSLVTLSRMFRRERFDAVHSVTPKAGLLAMVAAKWARVPLRTHTFTGQVWATKRGLSRWMLKTLDKVNHASSSFSLVDSGSQREFLIANSVVSSDRSGVLADGSIAGVDTLRFSPDDQKRLSIRAELGFQPQDVVIFYLGRLKREKGILDLARAFAIVHKSHSAARLLIVGPDEEGLSETILDILADHRSACRLVPGTMHPEEPMAAADIFCLPSYREGFGSVLIEAAAAGVPSVASRIYGISDAVVEGMTGLLHPPGDVTGLASCIAALIDDPGLRARMGEAARQRAITKFSSARLSQAMVAYYHSRLGIPPERRA